MTTTWSPVSRCGEKLGLCLPRSRLATSDARRPSTTPSASTSHHSRVISLGLVTWVFIPVLLSAPGTGPVVRKRRITGIFQGNQTALEGSGLRLQPESYSTETRHRPWGGATGPAAERSLASRIEGISAGDRRPSPT